MRSARCPPPRTQLSYGAEVLSLSRYRRVEPQYAPAFPATDGHLVSRPANEPAGRGSSEDGNAPDLRSLAWDLLVAQGEPLAWTQQSAERMDVRAVVGRHGALAQLDRVRSAADRNERDPPGWNTGAQPVVQLDILGSFARAGRLGFVGAGAWITAGRSARFAQAPTPGWRSHRVGRGLPRRAAPRSPRMRMAGRADLARRRRGTC